MCPSAYTIAISALAKAAAEIASRKQDGSASSQSTSKCYNTANCHPNQSGDEHNHIGHDGPYSLALLDIRLQWMREQLRQIERELELEAYRRVAVELGIGKSGDEADDEDEGGDEADDAFDEETEEENQKDDSEQEMYDEDESEQEVLGEDEEEGQLATDSYLSQQNSATSNKWDAAHLSHLKQHRHSWLRHRNHETILAHRADTTSRAYPYETPDDLFRQHPSTASSLFPCTATAKGGFETARTNSEETSHRGPAPPTTTAADSGTTETLGNFNGGNGATNPVQPGGGMDQGGAERNERIRRKLEVLGMSPLCVYGDN